MVKITFDGKNYHVFDKNDREIAFIFELEDVLHYIKLEAKYLGLEAPAS